MMDQKKDCVVNDLLDSSEVQNSSCRISTILKPFLVSSSSCHDAHPLFIRPMLKLHKMVPKMLFFLANSIAPSYSRGNPPWRRRLFNFFVFWIINGRIILWLNIGPNSFRRWAGRNTSLWFRFDFDRLANSTAFKFNAHSSNCISEVSCSVSSWSLVLVSRHEKLCPVKNEHGLCSKTQFWFPLHIYLVNTRFVTSSLAFPRIQPSRSR